MHNFYIYSQPECSHSESRGPARGQTGSHKGRLGRICRVCIHALSRGRLHFSKAFFLCSTLHCDSWDADFRQVRRDTRLALHRLSPFFYHRLPALFCTGSSHISISSANLILPEAPFSECLLLIFQTGPWPASLVPSPLPWGVL